jgi:hypothetical protein
MGAYAGDADDGLQGYVLNLGGGGVFTLMNGTTLVTAGNYSVDGDELWWGTDSFCAEDEAVEQATYTWALDDGMLLLTPKGVDSCEQRVTMYSHRFELMEPTEVVENEATGSAAASPVGAYTIDVAGLEGYVLNLGGGGVFNLMDGPSLVTAGNYSVDGGELTWLTDSFCAEDEAVEQATYTWVLDDGTLRLTPKGVDGCEARVTMYSQGFELLVPPEVIEYEATFGEEFTSGDGIMVTVSEPVEFTPSEEVSAMPVWGPLDLKDWDHFVRVTVTWRNESGQGVPVQWVSVEDGQVILDEASGLEEMAGASLEAGEEVSYDVGFGVADPADVQVRVSLSSGFEEPPVDASVTFTS